MNANTSENMEDMAVETETTTYTIWSEGYVVPGVEGKPHPATLLGEAEGEDFREACFSFFANHPLTPHFDASRLTVWGCKLYPTEEEARETFG